MSFSRYPAYKRSRVEQLGDVPEHWEVVPVKRCLKSIIQGWSPQCENYPADAGQWGVLKVGCVNGGSFDPSENKALPPTLEPLPELSIRQGDVLVSRANTRELVGSVAVAERDYERLMLCDKLYRLRVDEQRCDAAFLASSLSTPAARGVIEAAASGASSSMLNIGQAAITGMLIAIPPLIEQQALVAFVQNETAKIDALVEEQRRLIELLKEKRQAVISQAVTKGLNPNVPMKDSGAHWLGKVPAHWDIGALKRFWNVTDCKHITAEFVEVGVPLASIREVQGWEVNLTDAKQTTDYFYEQLVEGGRKPISGDIIFTRNAAVGEAALVPHNVSVFAMGQDVCLLRRMQLNFSTDFMLHQIKSVVIKMQLENVMIGSTFKRVNVEEIRGFVVCMPPDNEQVEIAAWLAIKVSGLDALIAEAARGGQLLHERRSALISAAVTGKIDVRGLHAMQPTGAA